MPRLTRKEKEAVCEILQERLAGCPEDLANALGCSEKEAETMWRRLVSAADKLAG